LTNKAEDILEAAEKESEKYQSAKILKRTTNKILFRKYPLIVLSIH